MRDALASEKALALALHRAGFKTDAVRVLKRVKIMEAELLEVPPA